MQKKIIGRQLIIRLKTWRSSNRYLGTTVKNQNDITEEVKSRLDSRNLCYHSVPIIQYSCLLSKSVEIEMYKIIILPIVLNERETWSLPIQEDRFRALENEVLRRILEAKRGGNRKMERNA
jgi:hypothetical protein